MDRVFNIAALIVGLAIIATLVSSKETKNIISSLASAFQGSIRAAKH